MRKKRYSFVGQLAQAADEVTHTWRLLMDEAYARRYYERLALIEELSLGSRRKGYG